MGARLFAVNGSATADKPYMAQERPGSCSLISLGNALIHFGLLKKPWDQGSREFERLVDLAGCRTGAAVSLAKAEAAYPIDVVRLRARQVSKRWVQGVIDRGGVVAMPIHDPAVGLHSVLVTNWVRGRAGEWFTVINREPWTKVPLVNNYDWDALGFRRWNVPIRGYYKK